MRSNALEVPHPRGFHGVGFAPRFFLFVPGPASLINPAPLPSTPQFSPFPVLHFVYRYSRAIMSRVCLH